MIKLDWEDIGTVGVEPIDQDHQQMALMINAVSEALETAEQRDRAKRLVDQLAERFETHCLREHRLFVPGGVDVRHERIAGLLRGLAASIDDGDDDAAALLASVAEALLEEAADDMVLLKTVCGQALDLAERRRYLRFRVALEVAARAGSGERLSVAQLIDISRGGCRYDGAEVADVGEEIVIEVLGELFPGVLVASDELGQHVRFNNHVKKDKIERILLHGVIERAEMAMPETHG
jgi:hypothetical protein